MSSIEYPYLQSIGEKWIFCMILKIFDELSSSEELEG